MATILLRLRRTLVRSVILLCIVQFLKPVNNFLQAYQYKIQKQQKKTKMKKYMMKISITVVQFKVKLIFLVSHSFGYRLLAFQLLSTFD